MTEVIERRFQAAAAVKILGGARAGDGTEGEPLISGLAAVFFDATDPAGTQYQLLPGLQERINPAAFNRALREKQDVLGLVNHDVNLLLARTSSGTMRLSVDRRGLRYEICPNRVMAPPIIEAIRRGDLSGSSFAFEVLAQKFVMGEGDQDDIREILDVNLRDCSIVASPAYGATTTGLRSLDGVLQAWKAERAKHGRPWQIESKAMRDRLALAEAEIRQGNASQRTAEIERRRRSAADRKRLAEVDEEQRQMQSAADRRQLDALEREIRQMRDNTLPCPPGLAELARQARARLKAEDAVEVGMTWRR